MIYNASRDESSTERDQIARRPYIRPAFTSLALVSPSAKLHIEMDSHESATLSTRMRGLRDEYVWLYNFQSRAWKKSYVKTNNLRVISEVT